MSSALICASGRSTIVLTSSSSSDITSGSSERAPLIALVLVLIDFSARSARKQTQSGLYLRYFCSNSPLQFFASFSVFRRPLSYPRTRRGLANTPLRPHAVRLSRAPTDRPSRCFACSGHRASKAPGRFAYRSPPKVRSKRLTPLHPRLSIQNPFRPPRDLTRGTGQISIPYLMVLCERIATSAGRSCQSQYLTCPPFSPLFVTFCSNSRLQFFPSFGVFRGPMSSPTTSRRLANTPIRHTPTRFCPAGRFAYRSPPKSEVNG